MGEGLPQHIVGLCEKNNIYCVLPLDKEERMVYNNKCTNRHQIHGAKRRMGYYEDYQAKQS